MSRIDRYPFAKATKRLCGILKISPERVLRRAGFPADCLEHEGKGITARECFELWNALVEEAKRPDLPVYLARIAARGTFNSAIFAFTCSPTIETGLQRLALFKPLVGPAALGAERKKGGLSISIASVDENAPMPVSFVVYELAFLLELARNLTAEYIVPLSVALPGEPGDRAAMEELFGVPIKVARHSALVLSAEDAGRPLLTENSEIWVGFEKELNRQLLDRDREAPFSDRIKSVLLELLPSGQSSAEAVCDYLHISKRSLYRHLQKEGISFQSILDETRSELAHHYLAKGDFSVQEISYLLAFRDPSSFYRAFRGWTGMTPLEVRNQQVH